MGSVGSSCVPFSQPARRLGCGALVTLAACGCGTSAPDGNPPTIPPKTRERSGRPDPNAGRDGFHVTKRGGLVLFSRRLSDGSYQLVAQRNGARRPTAVRAAPKPFQVDLGTDARGRPVAVFPRCRGSACRIAQYDPVSGSETTLAIDPSGHGSVSWPSIHRGVVTFAQRTGGATSISSAPADGSEDPTGLVRVEGVVRGLDTSDLGLAYVAGPRSDGVHVSEASLYLRSAPMGAPREVDSGGSGGEVTEAMISPSFAGPYLVWGVATALTGRLRRLQVAANQYYDIEAPGGRLFSVASDEASPQGDVVAAFDRGGPSDVETSYRRQVVRTVSDRSFEPADR